MMSVQSMRFLELYNCWHELSKILDVPGRNGKPIWEQLAHELGFNIRDIVHIPHRQHESGSNTIKMFHQYATEEGTALAVRESLERMKRLDALKFLNEEIYRVTQQMQRQMQMQREPPPLVAIRRGTSAAYPFTLNTSPHRQHSSPSSLAESVSPLDPQDEPMDFSTKKPPDTEPQDLSLPGKRMKHGERYDIRTNEFRIFKQNEQEVLRQQQMLLHEKQKQIEKQRLEQQQQQQQQQKLQEQQHRQSQQQQQQTHGGIPGWNGMWDYSDRRVRMDTESLSVATNPESLPQNLSLTSEGSLPEHYALPKEHPLDVTTGIMRTVYGQAAMSSLPYQPTLGQDLGVSIKMEPQDEDTDSTRELDDLQFSSGGLNKRLNSDVINNAKVARHRPDPNANEGQPNVPSHARVHEVVMNLPQPHSKQILQREGYYASNIDPATAGSTPNGVDLNITNQLSHLEQQQRMQLMQRQKHPQQTHVKLLMANGSKSAALEQQQRQLILQKQQQREVQLLHQQQLQQQQQQQQRLLQLQTRPMLELQQKQKQEQIKKQQQKKRQSVIRSGPKCTSLPADTGNDRLVQNLRIKDEVEGSRNVVSLPMPQLDDYWDSREGYCKTWPGSRANPNKKAVQQDKKEEENIDEEIAKVSISLDKNLVISPYSTQATKVMLTYAVDSEKHMKEVVVLYNCLKKNDFQPFLDMKDRAEVARDINGWIDRKFRMANYVLVCISPAYKMIIDANETSPAINAHLNTRVCRYIHCLMQNEYTRDNCKNKRFIPLLFPGATTSDIPPWLQNTICYIWRDHWQDILFRLLEPRRIIGSIKLNEEKFRPVIKSSRT